MKVVGIDFSLTSPAMGIIQDDIIAGLYCLRATKKQYSNNPLVTILEYPIYKTELERFDKLTNLMLMAIPNDIDCAYIENYAFGPSANMAFSIGECTGLFKYKFQKRFNQELYTVAPTQVKKHATGSGRASKRQMVDAFKQNEFDIYEPFSIIDIGKEKIEKPIDDIVDAYWIAKYGYNMVKTQKI